MPEAKKSQGGFRPGTNKLDGELSELQEEEDDEDQSEVTQDQFHAARKTTRTEDPNRQTTDLARQTTITNIAMNEEKIEKLQADFTKKLEAMKDLLSDKFDSKLSQVKENAKDSASKVQHMFESDINSLKAEMANL